MVTGVKGQGYTDQDLHLHCWFWIIIKRHISYPLFQVSTLLSGLFCEFLFFVKHQHHWNVRIYCLLDHSVFWLVLISSQHAQSSSENYDVCALMLGTGSLLVWMGVIRYIGFFKTFNVCTKKTGMQSRNAELSHLQSFISLLYYVPVHVIYNSSNLTWRHFTHFFIKF